MEFSHKAQQKNKRCIKTITVMRLLQKICFCYKGYYLPINGINIIKPFKLKVMKAKILMTLFAGMIVFAACKNRGSYEVGAASVDSVKTGMSMDTSQEPKLVKTAGIDIKVKNVQQSSEKISALTTQYKGTVIHHRIASTINRSNDFKINDDSVLRVSAFSTSGEITVKVPSDKLEVFTNEVTHLGIYVTANNMDIEDKSLDYLSSKLKLDNRKELVAQQKTGKVIIKNPTAVLNLKDDLVDEDISNRKIDAAVRYSVVSLNLTQSNIIMKEVIANDDPSAYNLPFFKRIGFAFENGWSLFKEVLIILTNMWVFIIAGVAISISIKTYRQRTRLV